jgi:hypothetical protein
LIQASKGNIASAEAKPMKLSRLARDLGMTGHQTYRMNTAGFGARNFSTYALVLHSTA